MGIRLGNAATGKLYCDKKRIGKVYVGSLLVYSISMFKRLLMERLYHTPIDGTDVKKSGQIKVSKIEGNGEIVNQLFDLASYQGTVTGTTFEYNSATHRGTMVGTCTNAHFDMFADVVKIQLGHVYFYSCFASGFASGQHILIGDNDDFQEGQTNRYIENGPVILKARRTKSDRDIMCHIDTGSWALNVAFGDFMCVDLTQEFGTGNEPTSLSDNRIKRIIARGYIPKNSGTYQGTIVQRFEDRGTNILDYAGKRDGYELINDQVVANSNWYVMPYAGVQPNTTYTQSGVYNNYISFFDINKNFISRVNLATFITPDNCFFVRKDNYKGYDRPMINIGETALPYVPARWQDFYEEVEYIESTGTQWIDSGVPITNTIGTDIEFALTSLNTTNMILMGALQPDVGRFMPIYYVSRDNSFRTDININNTVTYVADANINKHRMQYGINSARSIIFDNNTLSETIITNGASALTIYLFRRNYSSEPAAALVKIYYCKLYDNGILVRDFIPVYRKSDKKPGLYDRVNNVFYANQGTGEFVLGPNKKLPEEYREVEYLESTGTQYIDTEFKPNNSTCVDTVFSITSVTPNFIFGARDDSGTSAYTYYVRDAHAPDRSDYGVQTLAMPQTTSLNEKVHIVKNQNKTYYNDVLSSTSDVQSFSTAYTLLIYALHDAITPILFGYIRIYTFKIYDNNILVRDFVPCYRIIDRKPGLYDKVNNKFYTNSGTGEFVLGPDTELPTGYQELEYIESTGTQYIDSGLIMANDYKVMTKIMPTNGEGVQILVGGAGPNDVAFAPIGHNPTFQWFNQAGDPFVYTNTPAYIANTFYDIISTKSGNTLSLSVNGTTVSSTPSQPHVAIVSQKIFATHDPSTIIKYFCYVRLYYLQMYNSSTIVRSFIPARRLADNEIGLYDKVNNKFYSNQGSGFFIAGPEVNVRTSVMLPQPLKLDGAMNAHDTFEILENEYRFTRNVWHEDISRKTWTYDSQYTRFRTTDLANVISKPVLETDVANTSCPEYIMGSDTQYWAGHIDKTGFVTTGGTVYLVNHAYTDATAFKSAMTGVPFYYELATPQVINIPKKHFGYVRLKDLGWQNQNENRGFYSDSIRTIIRYSSAIFCNKYMYSSTIWDNGKCGVNNVGVLWIADTNYATPEEFINHFSDDDVLFYETQNEVSDPLLSIPFQKGGELNGQQYEIPVEYQKVEYIESTGTQYIDTGVIFPLTADIQITGSFMYAGSQNAKTIFGAQETLDNPRLTPLFWLVNSPTRYISFFIGETYDVFTFTPSFDVKNNFTISTSGNNYTVVFNSDKYSGTFNQNWPSYSMAIFANHYDGAFQQRAIAKLYSFTIYSSGDLVRDFIPCYRKSDGTIGLYDKVTNRFFTNQGTGTFLKGPDVNQIIDCEVLPNVEVKAQKY